MVAALVAVVAFTTQQLSQVILIKILVYHYCSNSLLSNSMLWHHLLHFAPLSRPLFCFFWY
jgi:hypothetical protein